MTMAPAISDSAAGDGRAFWVATAVFALLSVTLAVTSTGFLEADACSHFMIARGAWANPLYYFNVWGRPVCTGVYALPAHFGGRLGDRLTSLAMAVGTAAICRAIARGQGWRWPVLAAVFTYAQPMVLLHSFSELTELPFAILVAAGFLAYQRRQFFWMAVWVGLTPLGRPEGFALGLLAAGALVLHRRPWWLVVLGLPLLGWDVGGWIMDGRVGPWWGWLRAHWPWGQTSVYDRGYLMSFALRLPAVVGPFMVPATVLGAWLCLRDRQVVRDFFADGDNRRRCTVLIATLPVAVLVGHSLLYWRGKMASNGELRYMLTVTPFWALLSCRGWGWAFDEAGWRRPRLWAGLAAAVPLWCNRWYTVLPQVYSADWVQAEAIARWYRTDEAAQYPLVATSHAGLQFFIDPAPGRGLDMNRQMIQHPPDGAVLVWDKVGALFNADAGRVIPLAMVAKAGWVEIPTPWTGGEPQWHLFHSAPVPTTVPASGT